MNRKITLLLLLLYACYFHVSAQTPAQTAVLKMQLQGKLDSMQRANGFPGATFAAVLPNGERIAIATGTADSLTGAPMQPDHRMLSGSNGKTLFTAAALLLAEQGLFKLDDRIANYIGHEPWFNRIPNAQSITMRMLLNHTSGIEEYLEHGDFMQRLKSNPTHTWKPVELLAYIFDRKALFEAGTGFSYADANYILFSYILEKISGRRMYDQIKSDLIKPYGLTATEPSTKRSYAKLAVGYTRAGGPFPVEGAMVRKGVLTLNPQFEWAGGGFVSNAADLATWAKAYYDFKAISPALRAEMRQGVAANTGKNHQYGLAMQLRPGGHAGMGYGHSGWFPGYVTDAAYFPDLNIAVAMQFNTDNFRLLKRPSEAYLLDMVMVISRATQTNY
ncbi:serine hydrolase domain-containing protein [uncultured Pontibacter sp.]|uniref:serine hydrolase domain-containing protein n=1 Tax=uncultured Pontibacter sp. TaxID=453356 RepID=UPI00263329DE|nr:serine hydrolase domain-containing protein [uncultured Pontibacter sp.]